MREKAFLKVLTWTLLLALAAIAQPSARGDWVVKRGNDLFESTSGTSFMGVSFHGVPIGSFDFGKGAVPVSNTDTIVERQADVKVSEVPGHSGMTDLKLLSLQLETTTPVDFGLGAGFYFLTLQSARATGGPSSTGSMTIAFDSNSGGTFTSFFDVFFDLRKGALNGPIAQSGDLTLTNTGDTWGRIPPAGALTINGVNQFLLGGSNRNGDFWPGIPFQESHPGQGVHAVTNASIPEPSTWVMLLTAGMIVPAYARWRRRRAGRDPSRG